MNTYFDISSSEMKTLTHPSISTLYPVEVKNNFGVLEKFCHEKDGSQKFWEILLLNWKKKNLT